MKIFNIRKADKEGCILSPHLFNLQIEDIIQTSRTEKLKLGVEIDRRGVNKTHVDTMLAVEIKEDLRTNILEIKQEIKDRAFTQHEQN